MLMLAFVCTFHPGYAGATVWWGDPELDWGQATAFRWASDGDGGPLRRLPYASVTGTGSQEAPCRSSKSTAQP
jgi:hypothetical protein